MKDDRRSQVGHRLLSVVLSCLLLALFAGLNCTMSVAADDAEPPPTYVAQWGVFGSDAGQFNYPASVAVDSSGNVYVADEENHRIQKFDSNGVFQTTWGSLGSAHGQLNSPFGVAVDAAGDVYVADMVNNRVEKYDGEGNYLMTFLGDCVPKEPFFRHPYDVAVDEAGNVYVTDNNRFRIVKFNSVGACQKVWSVHPAPFGLAVDSASNVFVAFAHNSTIQKFDSNGELLTQWGGGGSEDGQLFAPVDVAVDGSGNVYVADQYNDRIQKFDNNGVYLTKWGSNGSEDGQFINPWGVAVDGMGNVYVADTLNHRIQKFAFQRLPTAEAGGPYTVVQGNTVTLTGKGSDPDGDALTFAWDLDNDGVYETPGQNAVYTGAGAPQTYTVALQVCDPTGACATDTAFVTVQWPFAGFFPPVDNPPTLNSVKAGSAVPIKFSLGGDHGLGILAAGYPASQRVTCDTNAALDEIEQTDASGNSGLQYNSLTGQYSYVWKTAKSWAGTCRQFTLRLVDGTDHTANFKFK